MKKYFFLLVLFLVISFPNGFAFAMEKDNCQQLNDIFSGKVKANNDVCKFGITRQNPKIMWNGMEVPPELMGFALSASFKKVDNQTIVMGEFALLEDEINPVIDALREGGLQVSALHNHWYGEEPVFFFLHFQGMGDTIDIAKTVESAIAKTAQ